jgi:predicted O-linked N-acetylglucosamine transferase (SPINDLY family)
MESWARGNKLPAPARRRRDGVVRVGFVSADIGDHSVWNAILKGWIEHIDPRRFEVHLFNLAPRNDAGTAVARRLVRRYEDRRRGLLEWSRTLLEAELDILVYPAIGMHSLTLRLAALRLAPVQAASWGHPETTGLPTIDYYLSAESLEPAGAEAHYTERLVSLPGLGVNYTPVSERHEEVDLRSLGLPVDVPLLLCTGSPFKYTPMYDTLWTAVSRAAPGARMVFFHQKDNDMTGRLAARLQKAYAAQGLDFNAHVSLIPFLDRAKFHGLLSRAALFLDSPGFSGFNSVMQAIDCGLPVVTHEGSFLRGRLGSGILRQMNMDELVAPDVGAYAALAGALSTDPGKQAACRARIQAAQPSIVGAREPVLALQEFFANATGSG